MGMLHLIRHGQASFGAANYDQLSALGARQCEALGRSCAERGLRFVAVWCGTLARHRQSLHAFAAGYGELPPATDEAGLNEYDSEALIRAVHPGPLEAPRTPEAYRGHFRLLRQALVEWTAGRLQPAGMPSHAQWRDGITAVLDRVRAGVDGEVLLFSSGGPIATATAAVMGAEPAGWIELNLRLRNSAVTEFAFTPKRHVLHSFNTLPHLLAPERADWVTYT